MTPQNEINEEESLLLQEETHEIQTSVTSFLGSKAKVALASISALCLLAVITWVTVPGIDSDVYGAMGMINMQAIHGRSGHRTGANTNSKQLIYLDRHNVECGNNPMSRWKGENHHWNFRVYYECSSVNMSPTSKRAVYTGRNEGHSLIYLDRFSMYCAHGEFMTRWHCHNDHWSPNFRYECARYNVPDGGCSYHHTHYIDAGNKEILYMDRFDVNCPSGQALKGWRGSGGWPHLRIDYTCCDISYHAPTQRPTFVPSPVPISDPTSQPIADPTKKPIAEPSAAPTLPAPIACTRSAKADLVGMPKPGCAFFSDKDIGWSKAPDGESISGAQFCTIDEMKLDSNDEEFAKLVKKGISYMRTGRGVTLEYTTKDGKKGVYDKKHREVVHTLNDNIETVVIKSTGVDSIPTKCGDM